MSKAWNGNRELEESIDYFSKDALAWNRNHFGNIHQKKRRILARIHGTQKALSINPSSSLVCLENQLLGELETILDQERDLWLLKSRLNWMIHGDRNTSFYHVSTLSRRKRDHIAAVRDERKLWITKEREVMEHFRVGFQTLYTSSQEMVSRNPLSLSQWHVQLSEEEKQLIDAMVSTEEIKEAL